MSLLKAGGGTTGMSSAIGSEVNRRRVTARGRSRLRFPRAQTRGKAWPSRGLAPRPAFALRRDITRDDAIDALVAGLLGDESQAEFFAHHRCQKAADRVGLPGRCLHYGGNGRALLPSLQGVGRADVA